MKIGIDLTALVPKATGVDTYLLGLVHGLAAVDRRHSYSVFVNRGDRRRLGELPQRFEVIEACVHLRSVRLAFQQAALPIVAALKGLDLLHSPSFILPLAHRRSHHVLTVHDMTSFSLPACHEALRRSPPYRTAVRASIRRAGRICVPSRAVRDEIQRLLPDVPVERIRVIPHGIGRAFRPDAAAQAGAVCERLGLPRRYVLYLGTIEPRKNLERLLEGYRRLVESGLVDEHLVLAGRLGWGYENVLALARSPALRTRVHLPGYIPETDLAGLYAGARAFVYPSLEEGFGLPPLEAMACGVPVVASNTPALAENLAGAAELVPPACSGALADALLRVLRDDTLRASRTREGLARARRFRWEKTARATLACYEELVRDGPSVDRSQAAA